jgi:hypothetical protein
MKVLVAGGLTPGFEKGNAEEVCARAIGRALASSGHVLLNGSYNDFDRIVAESSLEAARENPDFGDPKMAIHTYLSPGVTPAHRLGLVRNLNVNSWDPGQPEWGIPEPLRECEALIVMGGGPATHRVVHLTRLVGKPILPITAFGGAAKEAFRTEWAKFESFYGGRVQRDEYAILDMAVSDEFDELARRVIALLSNIVTGNKVFVVMSFRRESDDTYGTIDRVCKAYRFEADRTDKDAATDRIYGRIVEGIKRAAFVIADVTFESVNVYYELGFAEALGKDVIVIAKKDSKLPFDTNDIPTTFFDDQTRLEEALRSRIGRMTRRPAASE